MNNIDVANIIFFIGNILLFMASFPMMKTIIKERKHLKGYNFIGATMTYLAVTLFLSSYALLDNWFTILIAFPTVIMWGLVIFYLAHNFILSDSESTSSNVVYTKKDDRNAERLKHNKVMKKIREYPEEYRYGWRER